MPENDPVELEKQGWEALSAGGEAARAFYEGILDHQPVMLLPGGIVMRDRDAIIESMSGQPWSSFELEDIQCSRPVPDAAMVCYGVVAHRGSQRYSAVMSSVYVNRSGAWQLALHQQTPR